MEQDLIQTYFGYASGILITLSFVPYLITLFQGKTKPERVSWFIWSLLGGIAFFTQLAKGASHSLWLPGAQTILDLLVFLLAIKYGMGGWHKRDKVALVIVFLSLVFWYITNEPMWTLFIVIAIDAVGAVLTIIKSYENPGTESLSSWMISCLGAFLAIFSVESSHWVLLVFPIYIMLATFSVSMSILLGKRNLKVNK